MLAGMDLEPLAVALVFSLALTPIVRSIAIRAGMVAQPKADRWHRKPTALLGGAAIAATVALTCLLFPETLSVRADSWFVLAGSLFLCVVGFVDDIYHIKPYQKLICQVMAAALVISAGLTLPWTGSEVFDIAITFFWLVGITNAINLLDNMDGLAAGVSATAAIFLAINLALNGQPGEAVMLGILAAALIGFLFYNTNPASIFMGDTGSMFIGFFLAGSALLSASGARSRSFVVVLAVPVLVLLIPIFDTTLVTIMRKLAGRPASQGGRDHTSHRLVALGMSELRAVWLLYGLAVVSGMLAVAVNHLDWRTSIAVIVGFAIVLSLLGIYLGGVRVYDEAEAMAARQRPVIAFIVDLSYKRRIFEVLLDLVLIMLAFYWSSTMLGGPLTSNPDWSVLSVVSVLVLAQMFSLVVTGSYRGLWRYVSIDNVIGYAKGVVLGTVLAYLTLRYVLRLEVANPAVFVLDALLLFLLIASSRGTFRLFRRLIPTAAATPNARRALIYGAGDGGEILLRELQNNRDLGLTPIGFVDDDDLKSGRLIHGLPVHLATPHGLIAICETQKAEEVVVSTAKLSDERVEELAMLCATAGIVLRRMRIELEVMGGPAVVDTARRRQMHDDAVASLADVRRRRDSQPVNASDGHAPKRRDSKPFRALKS